MKGEIIASHVSFPFFLISQQEAVVFDYVLKERDSKSSTIRWSDCCEVTLCAVSDLAVFNTTVRLLGPGYLDHHVQPIRFQLSISNGIIHWLSKQEASTTLLAARFVVGDIITLRWVPIH